jgi:hypothetical protein
MNTKVTNRNPITITLIQKMLQACLKYIHER